MFKKLKEKIDAISGVVLNIQCEVIRIKTDFREIKNRDDRSTGIIDSQQKTIKTLTDALCDKYEHGLFIYSEDCKIPMVIRNGKILTNNLTDSFSIDWTPGEVPYIKIEQCAGTFEDDER